MGDVVMRAILGLFLTSVVVLAGCGSADRPATKDADSVVETPSQSPSASPPRATPSADAGEKGRVIKTAGSDYGQMLFDSAGQAIYLFDKETTSAPGCYGQCAQDWPPILTKGPPQASGGARQELLGTTRRKDGSMQVTYDGHPLYSYTHEEPNQVLCHNVSEYGGLWLVVTPSGEPAD